MNKKIQTLGARNFVCNICNLKFLRRTDLTRHNKTKKHLGTVYSLLDNYWWDRANNMNVQYPSH